jgi:hypothetical protein
MFLEKHIVCISPISSLTIICKLVNFTHYIYWYPYIYGLGGFSIMYPYSLALRGTLALHEYVRTASHYTCFTLGENAEYQLNRRLDGAEICPGSSLEVKNLLTLPGT